MIDFQSSIGGAGNFSGLGNVFSLQGHGWRRPDPSIVRVMIQRRKVIIGAVGVAAAATAAGCSSPAPRAGGAGNATWTDPANPVANVEQATVVPVRFTVTPES